MSAHHRPADGADDDHTVDEHQRVDAARLLRAHPIPLHHGVTPLSTPRGVTALNTLRSHSLVYASRGHTPACPERSHSVAVVVDASRLLRQGH